MKPIYQAGAALVLLLQVALGLEAGDQVSLEALQKAEFIKGEAPKEWAEDVYIIECWATWCGPCLDVIPHVNDLYGRYQEKGLQVIGMNVLEGQNKDGVVKFVENKGDEMAYPVAFAKDESLFQKDWFDASGARGIPHSFIVKGGKLVMQMHPGNISDELVERLLDPAANADDLIAEGKKEKEKEAKIQQVYLEYVKAQKANDEELIGKSLNDAKELDEKLYSYLQFQTLTKKEDWEGMKSLIQNAETDISQVIMEVFISTDESEVEVDQELLKMMEFHLEMPFAGGTDVLKSRLYTRIGDSEKALEFAQQALADAREENLLPVIPFEEFVQAIKDGKSMTILELQSALMKAQN